MAGHAAIQHAWQPALQVIVCLLVQDAARGGAQPGWLLAVQVAVVCLRTAGLGAGGCR